VAISTADFKTGLTIEYEGNVYQIVDFQHVKPGKGGAFVRSRIKNLMTGNTIDKTWRAGDKMDQAIVERRNVEFLYTDGEDLVFMDMSDFEQMTLPAKQVGRLGQVPQGKHDGSTGAVERSVDQPGTAADDGIQDHAERSGVRGDTAQGGSKPATLETGAVVTVPLFVNEGETIRVDTRTGQYIERVKK
jgi:elongation factor P